jgi:peptidoglycan/LPS O-acetylase OafA/YrhL
VLKEQIRYKSLDGLRGLAAYTVVLTDFSNNTNIWGGVLGYRLVTRRDVVFLPIGLPDGTLLHGSAIHLRSGR